MSRTTIHEIADFAHVLLRTPAAPKPFDQQFITDLVNMRRQGLFRAIWIDADRIGVVMPGDEIGAKPQRLKRADAERLIAAWKGTKRAVAENRKRRVA